MCNFWAGKEIPEDDETQRLLFSAGAEYVLRKVKSPCFCNSHKGFKHSLALYLLCSIAWYLILNMFCNLKVLMWEEEGNNLDRLNFRLSQLYYDNFLKVRFSQ